MLVHIRVTCFSKKYVQTASKVRILLSSQSKIMASEEKKILRLILTMLFKFHCLITLKGWMGKFNATLHSLSTVLQMSVAFFLTMKWYIHLACLRSWWHFTILLDIAVKVMGFWAEEKFQWGLRFIMSRRLLACHYFGLSRKISIFN